LSALRDHPEIAVLFTDIRMPGPMDGLELAACVHKLRPDIHLVVTSGHVVIADAVLPAGGTFVGKPYRLDQLIQVIGSKIHQLD
jgi:DNA-binding NtrC family response regulator